MTGATGFTGQNLCRKLAAAGARVRAVARESSNTSVLDDIDIDWIRGEIDDEATLPIACEQVNYIFHLAAAFRQEKGDIENY